MLTTPRFDQDTTTRGRHRYSLGAVLVAMALHASYTHAADATNKEQTLTVEASGDSAGDTTATDYSVPVSRAGTKMDLLSRQIPQSVSIISQQRMEDQQLQSVGEVLNNTTAVMENTADLDRKTYYARGFLIDNYMIDGIPTVFEPRWNLGDAQSDSALYERVEVVRGATGLMTGAGNPSAAVNWYASMPTAVSLPATSPRPGAAGTSSATWPISPRR